MILTKPLSTEKAVKLIEAENTIVFLVDKKASKLEIKNEIEIVFKVKVDKINVLIRDNKKYAYIKLKKENPAIDIATKLGMI
jgi:large subunit ribosomal protein L23